jgi:hypothetical protein
MSVSVYAINKGINRPIEFRGLKAQYIWWLGGGLVLLLILFAVLYICGVNTFVCLGLVIAGGSTLFIRIHQLSRRYGQHGMMKAIARRSLPRVIKVHSRTVFIQLCKRN